MPHLVLDRETIFSHQPGKVSDDLEKVDGEMPRWKREGDLERGRAKNRMEDKQVLFESNPCLALDGFWHL